MWTFWKTNLISTNEILVYLYETEFKELEITTLEKKVMLKKYKGKRTTSNLEEASLHKKRGYWTMHPFWKRWQRIKNPCLC
jgi:hypothetical protein